MKDVSVRIIQILIVLFIAGAFFGLVTTAKAAEVIIENNGSSSDNTVSISNTSSSTVVQENNSAIDNTVSVESSTGDNEANGNTNGTVQIQTGDTQSNFTVENSTNHSALTSGCCSDNQTNVVVSGNGSYSNNEANLSNQSNKMVVVNQQTKIKNNIYGYGDTGNNQASDNNGNVSIKTGDVIFSQNVKNGPINTSSVEILSGNAGQIALAIKGNGAYSDSVINALIKDFMVTHINNKSDIFNNIEWIGNTGKNKANDNTGTARITTGDVVALLSLENGPINLSSVTVDCCSNTQPETPSSGEKPGEKSTPTNQGQPTSASGSAGNGGGGSGSAGGGGGVLGAALPQGGALLPASGSYFLLLLTILSGMLFAAGIYLRLHPGQDPGFRFAV